MMLNSCLCRGALLLRHRTSASGLAKRLLGGEGGRGNAKGTAVRKIKIVPKKETGNEGGEAKPEVAKVKRSHLNVRDVRRSTWIVLYLLRATLATTT